MSIRALVFTAGATALSAVIVLVAFLVWAVGRGQYLEDYCFTRAPEPSGLTEATGGGRGPLFEGPATLRCIWEDHPDVIVQDGAPLAWSVACLVAVVLTLGFLWWLTLTEMRGHRNADTTR